MAERLNHLEQRVEAVADLLDRLHSENDSLREQNASLKAELVAIKQDYDSIRLSHTDQDNTIKEKLRLVLVRLQELEGLQS